MDAVHKRDPFDFYPTPAWCVKRLIEKLDADQLAHKFEGFPGKNWLAPGAGEGSLIRNVGRTDINWTAVELRPECRPVLEATGAKVEIADYLKWTPPSRYDVIFANPPFGLAMEFIEASLLQADMVIMLLRMGFLSTAGRSEFMNRTCPDVYIIPERPSFTANGHTDNAEYGWYLWRVGARRSRGQIAHLAPTPLAERNAKPIP